MNNDTTVGNGCMGQTAEGENPVSGPESPSDRRSGVETGGRTGGSEIEDVRPDYVSVLYDVSKYLFGASCEMEDTVERDQTYAAAEGVGRVWEWLETLQADAHRIVCRLQDYGLSDRGPCIYYLDEGAADDIHEAIKILRSLARTPTPSRSDNALPLSGIEANTEGDEGPSSAPIGAIVDLTMDPDHPSGLGRRRWVKKHEEMWGDLDRPVVVIVADREKLKSLEATWQEDESKKTELAGSTPHGHWGDLPSPPVSPQPENSDDLNYWIKRCELAEEMAAEWEKVALASAGVKHSKSSGYGPTGGCGVSTPYNEEERDTLLGVIGDQRQRHEELKLQVGVLIRSAEDFQSKLKKGIDSSFEEALSTLRERVAYCA